MKRIVTLTFVFVLIFSVATSIFAAPPDNAQDTPADVIHPNIHSKVGQGDGANANPNGNGNGGQIHGIGNVPGQNADNDPGNGEPGFADQLETVHGGIGAKNKNANGN